MNLGPFLQWLLGFFPPLVRDVIIAGLGLEAQIQALAVGQKIESDPPAFRNQWGKSFEYRVSVKRIS